MKKLKGNKPLKIVLSIDKNTKETRLKLGYIAVNGYKFNEDKKWFQFWKSKFIFDPEFFNQTYTKKKVNPVNFTLNTIVEDKLIQSIITEIKYNEDSPDIVK